MEYPLDRGFKYGKLDELLSLISLGGEYGIVLGSLVGTSVGSSGGLKRQA